jgi:hypothetical protein
MIRDGGVLMALRQETQSHVPMIFAHCPFISEWRIEYIRM